MLRDPVAFLSYVRSDDEHDDGKITAFRERLEGEVLMQTGKKFEIFQDRNDLIWGQNWEERINKSLSEVSFLIPILTPSFFVSPACRNEFEAFLKREQTIGVDRLILSLYYVTAPQLSEDLISDPIAKVMKSRHWTDWRSYRFKKLTDEEVMKATAQMATMIKDSIRELDSLIATAAAKAKNPLHIIAVEPAEKEISHEPPHAEIDVVPKNYSVPEFLDNGLVWPAPGSEDTELGVLMEPEVRHGAAEVYTRVQA